MMNKFTYTPLSNSNELFYIIFGNVRQPATHFENRLILEIERLKKEIKELKNES